MTIRASILVVTTALSLSVSGSAQAGVVFANDNYNLYTVDSATGLGTLVGNMLVTDGQQLMIDMAASTTSLYGLLQERINSVTQTRIATINPTNGQLTVAPLISGIVTTSGPASRIDAIAYDSASQMLYGVNNGPDSSLYRIDAATGAASLVGAVPVLPSLRPGSLYRGLGFGAGGSLFGAIGIVNSPPPFPSWSLVSIDAATGAPSLLGATGTPSMADLAWDEDTQTLYGGGIAVNGSTGNAALYRLDTFTGAASLIGTDASLSGYVGLAVMPQRQAVPEPASLALTAMALAGVGLAQRQRKRRSS